LANLQQVKPGAFFGDIV